MWWGLALGLFLGACAGTVVVGLIAAARKGDDMQAEQDLRRTIAFHHRHRIGPCTDCVDANRPDLAETKVGEARWR